MRDDLQSFLAAVDLEARRDADVLAGVHRFLTRQSNDDENDNEAALEQALDLAQRTFARARASHAWWRHSFSIVGPARERHGHATQVLADVYALGGPADHLEQLLVARDRDWAPPRLPAPSSVLPFPDLRYQLVFPLGLQLVWAPNGLHLRLYVTNLGPEPLHDLRVEGTDAVGRLLFVPAADADPRRLPPGTHVGFGVEVAHAGQGDLPLRVTLTTTGSAIDTIELQPVG